jgi:hypothetical protein
MLFVDCVWVCMGVEPTRPQVGMLAENPELAGLIVIYYADVPVGAICFRQVCCALMDSSGGGRDRDALARIGRFGSRSATGASR